MSEGLLLCTDLDRTLIPNGPGTESPGALAMFRSLVARPEVTLVYVSGRDRNLVEKAAADYRLPSPDFVVADVGSSIYRIDAKSEWHMDLAWEKEIAVDWGRFGHDGVAGKLSDVPGLRLQEPDKQNRYKLSYYVPLLADTSKLADCIFERLRSNGIRARLIWSVDVSARVGLLDVLPARVSKYHAIESLMRTHGFDAENTVFCGDSGNDIEVLVSSIPAVLVANAEEDVRRAAQRRAGHSGQAGRLYLARGGFMGMNGNYCAGMLEGIAHHYPHTVDWMVGRQS